MKVIKKMTCSGCCHTYCNLPILENYGRTISQLQDRCMRALEGEVFYVLVLSEYATKVKKNL